MTRLKSLEFVSFWRTNNGSILVKGRQILWMLIEYGDSKKAIANQRF